MGVTVMNGQTSKWAVKFLLWLVIEMTLNLVGMDDLVDYGEFLFEHPTVVQLCIQHPLALAKRLPGVGSGSV
jgi:hypothetical protein